MTNEHARTTAISTLPEQRHYPACAQCRAFVLCQPGAIPGGSDLTGRIVKHHRAIRRGAFLYRTGDSFQSVSAICSGAVKTCVVDAEGSLQVTGFNIAGELSGLDAACGRKHPRDAVATEDTAVCEILFSRLEELTEESAVMRGTLFRLMCEEIVHEQETARALMGKQNAERRLAAFLLCLCHRLDARGLSVDEFDLPMSQADIGNLLGLAKETVSRVFSRFQAEGLIRLHGKHVQLQDARGLESLAGEQ